MKQQQQLYTAWNDSHHIAGIYKLHNNTCIYSILQLLIRVLVLKLNTDKTEIYSGLGRDSVILLSEILVRHFGSD